MSERISDHIADVLAFISVRPDMHTIPIRNGTPSFMEAVGTVHGEPVRYTIGPGQCPSLEFDNPDIQLRLLPMPPMQLIDSEELKESE